MYLRGCFYYNSLDFCDGFVSNGGRGSSKSSSSCSCHSPLQELAQRRGAQPPADTHGYCALNRIALVRIKKKSYSNVIFIEGCKRMSAVTKDSCSRIFPDLLPFVEHCLASEELNTQGGVLEVRRPRSR